eukprot:scaffold14786_cov66-Phaeocystis_antarctica.AAC.1
MAVEEADLVVALNRMKSGGSRLVLLSGCQVHVNVTSLGESPDKMTCGAARVPKTVKSAETVALCRAAAARAVRVARVARRG